MSAAELLAGTIAAWVADPDSAVVYAEEVEDRWAVRMTQTVRDATTVWWEPGERSLRMQAYLGPVPDPPAAFLRLLLVRNRTAWRCHFARDEEGGAVVRARVANDRVTAAELDAVLGECFELIELTFPPLLRMLRG